MVGPGQGAHAGQPVEGGGRRRAGRARQVHVHPGCVAAAAPQPGLRRASAQGERRGRVSLGWKLFVVFLAFLAILTTVIMMAFRERRRAREIRSEDIEAQRSADGRVMAIIFTAIIGGMGLTVLTAWLVFF